MWGVVVVNLDDLIQTSAGYGQGRREIARFVIIVVVVVVQWCGDVTPLGML